MTAFGFFVAAGGVTAILWSNLHHRQIGVSENEFWIGTWLTFLGGIIGAKALFVILGWHHYATGELHFWSNFGTGFIFFGGLSGALATAAIFAWWRGLSFWRGADYFAFALPLGHAIGRVGCFLNGCCPGRPPHPTQLYESAGLLAISLACFFLLKLVETSRLPSGTSFCGYLFLYGLLRLLLDPLRADGLPERFWGFSHQQGLAIAFMLLAGVSALLINRNRRRSVNAPPLVAPPLTSESSEGSRKR
jgi:phosphatidylglycerol---prolipoprotein diacylglyceryl transferase